MMQYNQVRQTHQKDWTTKRFTGKLLALDPGETTGVAVFDVTQDQVKLEQVNQVKTWPLDLGVKHFQGMIKAIRPKFVVFERYGIYKWKTEQHTNSDVPTLQVIGCIRTFLHLNNIPYTSQTAQNAKQFMTDEKLKAWNFYPEGLRHGRDAIRHGLFYLLFGQKD